MARRAGPELAVRVPNTAVDLRQRTVRARIAQARSQSPSIRASTSAKRGVAINGSGLEVARWLVERKGTVTGSDTSVTEVSPNPTGQTIPVHQELMMKNGIFNIENMTFEELAAERAYEFLFVATPIRFEGATGSPLRPLAIR